MATGAPTRTAGSTRTPRGRELEAAHNDELVLEAARDAVAAMGAEVSVAAVAARAGVGIGTLYRRYASKEELLQRVCVLAMEQVATAGRRALLIDDPWEAVASFLHECVAARVGMLAPLAGTVPLTGEMAAASARGLRLTSRLAQRAQRAGVLRSDVSAVDLAMLVEQLSHRRGALDPTEDRMVRERLLGLALDGLRAGLPGPTPLPGRPLTPARYRQRWATPA